MNQPTKDEVLARAKQLFEEETGHPWRALFPKGAEDAPAASSGDEAEKYITRARIELSAIEEEGHS